MKNLVFLACLLAVSGCGSGGGTGGGGVMDLSGGEDVLDVKGDKVGPGDAQDSITIKDLESGDAQGKDGTGLKDTLPDGSEPEVSLTCESAGGFLCPCEGPGDCMSNYCIQAGGGKVCTIECMTDCPLDWVCTQNMAVLPDIQFLCLPGDSENLCKPCNSDAECDEDGSLCVPYGKDGSFCGSACTQKSECPSGYDCKDVETDSGAKKQCARTNGLCTCTPWMKEQQLWTSCEITNGDGTCQGRRTCTKDGLGECIAADASAEVCDGKDNNCNGKVDEAGAEGCTKYYPDEDKDGVGAAEGEVCLCQPPEGMVLVSGDCNDKDKNVSFGKPEVCDLSDNDCDGEVDEGDATGCTTWYFDKDKDGFGDSDVSSCRCHGDESWVAKAGDCDDNDPMIGVGQQEICDELDNDCDGEVDEEGADGCKPYFLDGDNDGFGLREMFKCLCKPWDAFSTTKPGDCDDLDASIKPTAVEHCDGIDNNCNDLIDDGQAALECPPVPNAKVGCDKTCVIMSCDPAGTWYDMDKLYDNGCECQDQVDERPIQTCDTLYYNLGDLPDNGMILTPRGKILPAGDVDWYRVRAVDGPQVAGCDTFHFKVSFQENPGGAFAFEVYKGACNEDGLMCTNLQVFEDYVDFNIPTTKEGEVGGECLCAPAGSNTAPNSHRCSDQTATYMIKVYAVDSKKVTCDEYVLLVQNGLGK